MGQASMYLTRCPVCGSLRVAVNQVSLDDPAFRARYQVAPYEGRAGAWIGVQCLADPSHVWAGFVEEVPAPARVPMAQEVVMKVHIKKWEAGDWYEVYVDGAQITMSSGHSIDDDTWISLLRQAQVEVTEEIVST